jgi:molybdenum cofactor cytidylyltransferase
MIVGILLAAGAATRFGGDKLLADLRDGQCVAELACANLRPAVDRLVTVVRPGANDLSGRLATVGAEVFVFEDAAQGIGASIAHAVTRTPKADGWLIALGDMPLVGSANAIRIADSLRAGAAIAVPVARGRRGHPVGFAHRYFAELAALSGDTGARDILAKHPADIVEVPIGDANAWHDVDTSDDLETARQLLNRL